jgi:hypothetical protein
MATTTYSGTDYIGFIYESDYRGGSTVKLCNKFTAITDATSNWCDSIIFVINKRLKDAAEKIKISSETIPKKIKILKSRCKRNKKFDQFESHFKKKARKRSSRHN